MRIINIVECEKCSYGNLEIIQIKSFPIIEEQLADEVVKQAEKLFKNICKENGVKKKDIKSYIEDGTFQKDGEWSVSIVWSDVEQL